MPDAGSYAPVTLLIEELPGGGTRVAYDTVTSAIAPYRDAAASQVAQQLDAEVLDLLRRVTGVPAPATPDPARSPPPAAEEEPPSGSTPGHAAHIYADPPDRGRHLESY